MDQQIQKDIADKISQELGIVFVDFKNPPQGMGSLVFLAQDEKGREYAIKMGQDVGADVRALELIAQSGIEIPVPATLGCFDLPQGKTLVMERIDKPLLEDLPKEKMSEFILPMLDCLKALHGIKSSRAGMVGKTDSPEDWKAFLLFKYSGKHPWFNWRQIALRDGVDSNLIAKSVALMAKKISSAELPKEDYSLLHTDFNQRNIFVDPLHHRIAGIIDWSEATFGDPLYDFARVRMLIWHFGLGKDVEETYFRYLGLSVEEKVREEVYLQSQILDYISWYSQEKDDFNVGRLKLHQDFLRQGF